MLNQITLLKNLSPLAIAILLFCFAVLPVSAQQNPNSFFIYDGKSMQKVENGNPDEIKVTEWQVWLYRTGQSTSDERNRWGVISAATAGAVMQKLKKYQDAELSYNAWAGRGRVPDERLTNFNPVGPIARVERASASKERQDKQRLIPKETWDKIQDAFGRAKNFREGYEAIIDILSKNPKTTTPFDNVGTGFRNYMEGLKGAMERANELRTILEDATVPLTEKIVAVINEITRNLDEAQAVAPRVARGFGISESIVAPPAPQPPTVAAQPTPKPPVNNNAVSPDKIEAEMNRIMGEFENIDPNDFEGGMRKINQLARQLSDLINKDPDSTADMKELARLLVAITGTTDMEKMTENLERLQQLMERIKP